MSLDKSTSTEKSVLNFEFTSQLFARIADLTVFSWPAIDESNVGSAWEVSMRRLRLLSLTDRGLSSFQEKIKVTAEEKPQNHLR